MGDDAVAAEMGKRFECPDLGGQYMITKGGAGELSCVEAPDGQADQLGKRYEDPETGVMVLCTKAGHGHIYCNGKPMQMLAPKTLPSSD
ncbi:MAG: hypothetical protein WD645_05890 [Dehalococcoidia bacterium]